MGKRVSSKEYNIFLSHPSISINRRARRGVPAALKVKRNAEFPLLKGFLSNLAVCTCYSPNFLSALKSCATLLWHFLACAPLKFGSIVSQQGSWSFSGYLFIEVTWGQWCGVYGVLFFQDMVNRVCWNSFNFSKGGGRWWKSFVLKLHTYQTHRSIPALYV